MVVEVELLARNTPIYVDDNDGCMVALISWFDWERGIVEKEGCRTTGSNSAVLSLFR